MDDKRVGKDGLGLFWGVTKVGMVGLLYEHTHLPSGGRFVAISAASWFLGFVLDAFRFGSGERVLVHLFT